MTDNPILLFEDNFNGNDLDLTKWEHCPEWKRGRGACIWDPKFSYLDGRGHLILHAEYDADGLVHSGGIRTTNTFYGGYGYYEASICFPTAVGTWGAFWMMVGDVTAVSASKGLEIDIVESINNESGLCNHALHWNYRDLHSVTSGQMKKAYIYDGKFHTFAVDRSEEGYVFYIDGAESWRAGPDLCEPCPEKGYMKVTMEAAGWAGAGSEASKRALPADMVVDYVRVYSRKP